VKPANEFHFTRRGELFFMCKECRSVADRNRLLLKRYGITLKQYEILLTAQGGVCAVCGNPPDDRLLNVDHDHSCCPESACGKCIRGLLCSKCNTGIAKFDDDAETLARAAEYVRQGSVQDWMMLED